MRWLAGVPTARLAPLLSRFAREDWTARDVERAAVDRAAARGWKILPQPDHPPAYLATLLREVDVEDRPGALDEQIAAAEAAQRRYERQLVIGTPCAHGQPAGDVPSPLRQHRACPLCRAAADDLATGWPITQGTRGN